MLPVSTFDKPAPQYCGAVPQDRADEPVRRFGRFTEDLEAIAAWLKECGVETVAMESTGVYWIPLFVRS